VSPIAVATWSIDVIAIAAAIVALYYARRTGRALREIRRLRQRP
jgi:hypothetical protein